MSRKKGHADRLLKVGDSEKIRTATSKTMNTNKHVLTGKIRWIMPSLALASLISASVQAQVTLPTSYAVPSASVDTTKKGFLVRTWKSPGQPNSIAWTEEQLAGLHGVNAADTTVFTDNIYG